MRHFDKFKYLTTSKSNISSCQKASTLTFTSLCSPLFCLNNIENIFGHSHFFGSSVSYKQHIEHVSFNFTCHKILAILGHSGRQTEIIKTFYILRRHQRFMLKKELLVTKISIAKSRCFCFEVAVLQICLSKSANCYCRV